MDSAVEWATLDEARAIRIAVSVALRLGVATDDENGRMTNRSLLAAAQKLGMDTAKYEPEEQGDE
jgi:hypothetical protein